MECMSCNIQIDPKWRHAIDQNNCPFCGQLIMEQELKDLFSLLAETMDQFSQYPNQLNDWMLSNHSFIKTDSPSFTKYIPQEYIEDIIKERNLIAPKASKRPDSSFIKIKTEDGIKEIEVKHLQSDEEAISFQKRAGAIGSNFEKFDSVAEKTRHIKALAEKIKKDGMTTTSAKENIDNIMQGSDSMGIDYNELMNESEELQQAPVQDEFDQGEDIPAIVRQMASKASNNSNVGQKSTLDIMREQEEKRRNSQKMGGSFSRG